MVKKFWDDPYATHLATHVANVNLLTLECFMLAIDVSELSKTYHLA